MEFFRAVLTQPFLQVALAGGVLVSLACGVVGSYVVTRRITYLAGGMAHWVLGGIGAAYYLKNARGLSWCEPLYGAVVAALLAAGIIGWVSLRARQREDTVISALWAIGMAAGVLFFQATPGYGQHLISYLFGNILLVGRSDLWLIAGLDVLVAVVALGFYRQLTAVCFDEEFARSRGINVEAWYVTLLALTALTVVLLVSIVGIMLVIALLTLPAAIAGLVTRRLPWMMALAVVASMVFIVAGFALSYQPDLPPGPVIVVLAGAAYLLGSAGRALIRRGRG